MFEVLHVGITSRQLPIAQINQDAVLPRESSSQDETLVINCVDQDEVGL